MFLLFDILFGLPGHALIVHAAVVLVPLAVTAFAATGWRAKWRTAYSLPVALLALAGGACAFLATQTGGPLEDRVKRAAETAGARARFGDHPENGDTAQIMAIAFAITAVAVWAIDRYWERWKLPRWSPMGAYVVGLIPAALALITMVIAGHSGATLVWKDVGSYAAGK